MNVFEPGTLIEGLKAVIKYIDLDCTGAHLAPRRTCGHNESMENKISADASALPAFVDRKPCEERCGNWILTHPFGQSLVRWIRTVYPAVN